ncbi:MAG: hypothetical protein GC190_12465 [Alphaproteobacteria bacterium]|nr:hypothetical protein [Alphaproteobacteria bacterium]
MRRFAVIVHGQNFEMTLDGKEAEFGVFATRFVDAPSPERASEAAIQEILADPRLAGRRNSPEDPPTLAVDKQGEVGWWTRRLFPPRGFSFYMKERE